MTENSTRVQFHKYTDISFAVATETGLKAPVMRNVESLTIPEISKVHS